MSNDTERDKLHKESGFNAMYDKTIKVDITDCASAKDSAKKVKKAIEEKGFIDFK